MYCFFINVRYTNLVLPQSNNQHTSDIGARARLHLHIWLCVLQLKSHSLFTLYASLAPIPFVICPSELALLVPHFSLLVLYIILLGGLLNIIVLILILPTISFFASVSSQLTLLINFICPTLHTFILLEYPYLPHAQSYLSYYYYLVTCVHFPPHLWFVVSFGLKIWHNSLICSLQPFNVACKTRNSTL